MCHEREQLIGYVYDECDAGARQRVDRHLEACATCREEISGLRATRQDLLAWEVPEHESVWRPFAPAPLTTWWREVPAWSLAAAAGVMFCIGAAGSVAAHAWVSHEPVQVAAQAPPTAAPVRVVDTGVRAAELDLIEQRVRASLRTDLDRLGKQVQLVSSHGVAASAANVGAREPWADRVARVEEFKRTQEILNNAILQDFNNLQARARELEQANGRLALLVSQLMTSSAPSGGIK
jgi:anti-sigma factor RsiW